MHLVKHDSINQELQVVRAIAITSVFVHHLVGLFKWDVAGWDKIGGGLWVGVDLFFCLSGYVIARSLLPRLEKAEGVEFWKETGAFWLRRLYRITPSAWLWLTLPMIAGLFFVHIDAAQLKPGNFADIAAAVLHVQNLHFFACTQGAGPCGDFAVYWTLSLEEQFYIVLPLLFLLSRKHFTKVLIVLVLAQMFIPRPQWSGIMSFIRTDAILLGVLLAIFSRTEVYKAFEPNMKQTKFRFIIPILLTATLFGVTRFGIVSFYTGLAAVVCTLIVWLCSYDKGYFMPDSVIRKPLVWLGARSYAIYLIHLPVFWATHEIWARLSPVGAKFDGTFTLRFAVTGIGLTLLLADLNFRFVEEPLRKRGKKYADKLVAKRTGEIAVAQVA